MTNCYKCGTTHGRETLLWHGGGENFCSMDCLPEGVLDEPFALQYVGLMESFQVIEKHLIIPSYFDQRELLEEVDYLLTQSEEYVLGDSEGNFYKERLCDLHNKLSKTQEEIASFFLKTEHFQFDYGLYIGWEHIRIEHGDKIAVALQTILQPLLNKADEQPMILYNQELDALNEDQNIVYYTDGDGTLNINDIHPIIEELHDVGKELLEPILDESDEWIFSYIELAKCPKCGMMEPWEDFSYKENYKILGCWSC